MGGNKVTQNTVDIGNNNDDGGASPAAGTPAEQKASTPTEPKADTPANVPADVPVSGGLSPRSRRWADRRAKLAST
jgi:hypothetical protein